MKDKGELDKIRVLRILEYVGEREWVEETLKRSTVPLNGQRQVDNGNLIKSAIIDNFPEILDEKSVSTTEHHIPYNGSYCSFLMTIDHIKKQVHLYDLDKGVTLTNSIDYVQIYVIKIIKGSKNDWQWILYHTDGVIYKYKGDNFYPIINENLVLEFVEKLNERKIY